MLKAARNTKKYRFTMRSEVELNNSFAQDTSKQNPEVASDKTSENIWGAAIADLKDKLDAQIFSAWIRPLSLSAVEVDSNSATPCTQIQISAPNKFCCEHVSREYASLISDALGRVTKTTVAVEFKVGSVSPLKSNPLAGSLSTALSEVASRSQKGYKIITGFEGKRPARDRELSRTRDESNLNPKYNFSNLVVGSCNQFAHAAGLRVAESLGGAYNPLFIYGGVGLGKTHLANAIGNASRRRGKNVLLASSESFVNELISALRSNRMPQFKSKFRSLDLLIVDDIQFIIGKERTQEEFFHTFNELYNRHKQIVVTSDRPPQELTELEDRLRTRFTSGLYVDMQAPDFETRVAILSKKAEAIGLQVPEEVTKLLAERVSSNVRELEGAFNRIQALSTLHQQPITVALADEALKSFAREPMVDITTDRIQRIVAEFFGVGVSDLLGKRRTQNIAFARHVAMFLCRTMTSCSYPEIGALFGGRDHSTVIHAFRTIEEREKNEAQLKADLKQLHGVVSGKVVSGNTAAN